MIQIKQLSKKFGSKTVLQNIDLQFEKGKVYGIVGENGAGKTTLFRCIAGLEDFDGEIKTEWEPLKDQLGILFADPFYFSKITGKEYLQLLCSARNIQHVDFDEKNIFDLPLNQYASTYSTGMKKKLAILGILLQKNEVFILDEPFNGVDIQSNIVITEIILKLKQLNKIVLLSSHIFSTLQATCDQLFLLKDGQILKSVGKESFDDLEQEMIQQLVGNRIDVLDLK